MRRWLQQNHQADQYAENQASQQRKLQFIALVQGAREKLKILFAADIPDPKKRERKKQIYARLKQDYRQLRAQWGGYAGYDAWFARDLNNAHLVPIGSYYDYVPAFQAMLERYHGDLNAFYESVERLAELGPDERRDALEKMMPKR